MAEEIKKEDQAAVATEVAAAPVSKKYIATENCFYEGKYLLRGAIILLEKKPNHTCLKEYKGTAEKKDLKYFDPIGEELERKRIAAALPGFIR